MPPSLSLFFFQYEPLCVMLGHRGGILQGGRQSTSPKCVTSWRAWGERGFSLWCYRVFVADKCCVCYAWKSYTLLHSFLFGFNIFVMFKKSNLFHVHAHTHACMHTLFWVDFELHKCIGSASSKTVPLFIDGINTVSGQTCLNCPPVGPGQCTIIIGWTLSNCLRAFLIYGWCISSHKSVQGKTLSLSWRAKLHSCFILKWLQSFPWSKVHNQGLGQSTQARLTEQVGSVPCSSDTRAVPYPEPAVSQTRRKKNVLYIVSIDTYIWDRKLWLCSTALDAHSGLTLLIPFMHW